MFLQQVRSQGALNELLQLEIDFPAWMMSAPWAQILVMSSHAGHMRSRWLCGSTLGDPAAGVAAAAERPTGPPAESVLEERDGEGRIAVKMSAIGGRFPSTEWLLVASAEAEQNRQLAALLLIALGVSSTPGDQ